MESQNKGNTLVFPFIVIIKYILDRGKRYDIS